MLIRDAEVDPPTHCITLTTVDPATTSAEYRTASASLWKRLRRHHGRVDYFGAIEFTTGTAARSGGYRRLHGHHLVKFRDDDRVDVLDLEALTRETWQTVTGAHRIEVAKLLTPGAAIGYLALHHRKPGQAPPEGWRGMVSRPSKGYFHRPVAELREQARRELRAEAIAHKHGISLTLAHLEVEAAPPARIVHVHEPIPGHFIPIPRDRDPAPINREAREAIARLREGVPS